MRRRKMTGASAGEISEFVRLCVKKEMPEQQQPDILSGYLCCVVTLFSVLCRFLRWLIVSILISNFIVVVMLPRKK